jgi:hypothetical protein
MQAATPPISLHGIARARCAGIIFLLALPSLWLTTWAGVPAAGSECAVGQAECTSTPKPKIVIDADEWKNAGDPRGLMVLIQSNLDRMSAGQPVWPAPKDVAPDARLQIVDAYADFLRGDFKGMDASIAKVEQAADAVPPRYPGNKTSDWKTGDAGFYKSFTAAMRSPSPLVRLYAALRDADGSLFNTLGNPFDRTNDGMRGTPSPLDGTWVRLPCRTVIGRVPQFVAAADDLNSLGGPVLDCPVDGPVDYANDEALALHPEHLSPHVATASTTNEVAGTPSAPAPPLPGSRDAALDEMGTHPQQTAPVLEHYSRVDAQGELDYALFLHSFEPQTPTRDAAIRALQGDLYKRAMASPGKVVDFPLTPYDGTDDSLLNIIRLASEAGITNGSDYDIPCPFLTARPSLIAATQPYYGSNRDNFMPRSGCTLPAEFPAKSVGAFEATSTQADGNFIDSFQGSMVYGFEAARSSTNQQMQLNPRFFLDPNPLPFGYPSSSFDYPYQVWGYTGLNNYVVSRRIRKLYLAAHDQLAAYYRKHMQLSRTDSEQAAKAALFLATLGGDCGGDVPTVSLRRRLLEQAPPDEIKRLLSDGAAYAQEIDTCSRYAGMDPLLLVAVADPAAFPLVMQHEPDINERNVIGKTALMEAAQFDQLGIVALLLEHHASVNATTGGNHDMFAPQLGNDARTALMYGAANGSLKLIRALLAAGADPYQADTKGYRAIDYLLGYGPTPSNPHLSERQRRHAAQWLF